MFSSSLLMSTRSWTQTWTTLKCTLFNLNYSKDEKELCAYNEFKMRLEINPEPK